VSPLYLSSSRKINKPDTKIIQLPTEGRRGTIPTTFVPLAPTELSFDGKRADLLFGVFHIMWRDMPRPRTYEVRLADYVSEEGSYVGCALLCGNVAKRSVTSTNLNLSA